MIKNISKPGAASINRLIEEFERGQVDFSENQSLAPFTTIGVGGPARLLAGAESSEQLIKLLHLSRAAAVPFMIIGHGSNIVVSDKGFPGLVILNKSAGWKLLGPAEKNKIQEEDTRYSNPEKENLFNTSASSGKDTFTDVLVRVDSGFKVGALIKNLFRHGISGLEWFSGIPSTVGGAIYMNMHGGHQFFGSLLKRALISDGLSERVVEHDYFRFGYDYSILHESSETIIYAELVLKQGPVDRARQLSADWARQKSIQPRRSAGCVFRNLDADQVSLSGLPGPSVGYMIDKVFNLKGTTVGGARIAPNHAAFIENTGKATAADVFQLIRLITNEAKKQFNIDLKLEVELIGEFE